MTLLDLLIKIFFAKKVIVKNVMILLLFNIISLVYIFSLERSVATKTIIFNDVPINATSQIYQNYDLRKLVEKGLLISILKDKNGFLSWDHKFEINSDAMRQDVIENVSNVLFRSIVNQRNIIRNKKDPRNKYILDNLEEYIELNKIKKFVITSDANKQKQFQKILSILIQANIFAVIIIFIFRIRLIRD